MPPRLLCLGLAVCMLALGCSRDPTDPLPAACREGPDAVRAALRSAPAKAEIGGVPLSGCLTQDSDAGDIQEVGAAFVGAAAELAPRARARPEGSEALRLGYLLGATRRGAEGTQGIHNEMLRRLEQELEPVNIGSREFRRGERAGRRAG